MRLDWSSTTSPHQAILLTPAGSAAIAVVRLLGANVNGFLTGCFSNRLVVDRPVHGNLTDGDRVIDDPVIVLHEGAMVADVNLHGGPWVVAAFLELCRREGFETVESIDGVLPELAVDGSDAIEVLMLRHLPLARTEEAVRMLLAQPVLWREFDLNAASNDVLERMAADESLWQMLHPPRVALVGAANVGKSTLANQLFAQARSITADVPGTTRDWVGEIANLDGLAVMLVDTPGLRATSDAIESEAIARSRAIVREADAIVIVLDASADETEQRAMLSRYPTAIRVMNKTDRAQPWSRAVSCDVATIATRGQGIDALRQRIRSEFGCGRLDVDHPRWWAGEQRQALFQRLKES